MSKQAKEPTDRANGIAYTLNGIPVKLWGQLKLICFQEQINLRQGLMLAIEQFVSSHKETLNAALESINDGEGGGDADVQPGE